MTLQELGTTDVVKSYVYVPTAEWIAATMLVLVSAYITVASIAYYILQSTANLAVINRLCVVCALSLLTNCLLLFAELVSIRPSDKMCDISLKLCVVFFAFNRGSLYFVLWIRQDSVYRVLSIRRTWLSWTKRASKLVYYYGVLMFPLLAVLFGTIKTSKYVYGDCTPQV